jgi:hypothetical protein
MIRMFLSSIDIWNFTDKPYRSISVNISGFIDRFRSIYNILGSVVVFWRVGDTSRKSNTD